jgi:hypothetical protein
MQPPCCLSRKCCASRFCLSQTYGCSSSSVRGGTAANLRGNTQVMVKLQTETGVPEQDKSIDVPGFNHSTLSQPASSSDDPDKVTLNSPVSYVHMFWHSILTMISTDARLISFIHSHFISGFVGFSIHSFFARVSF